VYVCHYHVPSTVLTFTALGRANERLARVQETYVASATTSWLEGLERSLVQMKEYQVGLPAGHPIAHVS
jgi:hypothetical protein